MFDPQNMDKMMKQMGMDVEEVDAKQIVVDTGDEEMVFESPTLRKISVQGRDMFQLEGDFSRRSKGPSQEDVELVAQKADVSEEEARQALEEHGDIADAVMSLQ
ncbi:MAG: nascent polypeptide-associated complex protein [Candidatus Nanohaloarchaea archaeon]|nr:nascent polypeptide-associated complex protein [Candidatus Nanohaloarchaea archaeon]